MCSLMQAQLIDPKCKRLCRQVAVIPVNTTEQLGVVVVVEGVVFPDEFIDQYIGLGGLCSNFTYFSFLYSYIIHLFCFSFF